MYAPTMIGWVATGVFCASYLFKGAATLRRVQAFGAGLWIFYGVTIGAPPVIVANVIVAGAALYSAFPASAGTARIRLLNPEPAAHAGLSAFAVAESAALAQNKNGAGVDAAVPVWLY